MKRGFLDKRGEALPLNVIIIAIIVIVVLVVVLLIFIGGIGGLQDKFKSRADDPVLAVSECENFCRNLGDSPSQAAIISSSYCSKYYKLDMNGDGKVDVSGAGNIATRFYCGPEHKQLGDDIPTDDLGVVCPAVTSCA